VNLAQRREIGSREDAGQSHQRWPEPAMDVGDLMADEPTNQHVT